MFLMHAMILTPRKQKIAFTYLEAAPTVLAYATEDSIPHHHRARQIVSIIALLPALIAPFLPFVFHMSPYEEAQRFFEHRRFTADFPLCCVAFSFFISYPILAWRLRRFLWRRAQ